MGGCKVDQAFLTESAGYHSQVFTCRPEASIYVQDEVRPHSFEEALDELESIVDRLETGDVALEESIEIYKRGNQLRAYCDEKLKSAQAKIEKITGDGGTAPLDTD